MRLPDAGTAGQSVAALAAERPAHHPAGGRHHPLGLHPAGGAAPLRQTEPGQLLRGAPERQPPGDRRGGGRLVRCGHERHALSGRDHPLRALFPGPDGAHHPGEPPLSGPAKPGRAGAARAAARAYHPAGNGQRQSEKRRPVPGPDGPAGKRTAGHRPSE